MASVVRHATRQIQDTGAIELFQSHKEGYADGEQRRDFVYVKDVCDIVLWFLDHPEVGGIYNVGTGQARTFNDLAAAIFQALGRTPNISYVPTPENIRGAYQYFTEGGPDQTARRRLHPPTFLPGGRRPGLRHAVPPARR